MLFNHIRRKSDSKNSIVMSAVVKKILIMVMAVAIILNSSWFGSTAVVRASSLIVTIDYTDETVTVNPGQSNKFYMSSDNKKTWELIDAGKMDISPYLTTKAITLYFKGNKDTQETPIMIPVEDNSLKPVYKLVSGAGVIEFTSAVTVQYRKGANGVWYTATSPMYTSMYELKGVTLSFRTAPTVSTRAGKVVNVKIPKRPSAPSVKLDVNKLCISGVKPGETQYRVGDNTMWTTIPVTTTKTNYLDLSTMLGGSTSANTAIPAGVIEFRSLGTDKKLSSAAKVIEVPQQATIASTAATMAGTTLTIMDSDTSKAYEYTKVSIGSILDFTKARWTSITSKKSVVIKGAAMNDKIYVRLKSVIDKNTKQTSLPSTYLVFTVSGISYASK